MPEHTPDDGGAGTAPAETEDAEPRTPNAEPRTFTQEDVDRIVAERLRRERQRVEKAVRDEFEGRIAELEAAGEQAQQARGDVETLSGALRSAENRALIAERLLAKGAGLPAPYAALVKGEDAETIDASIDAAREQLAADLRLFAKPATDVGAPVRVSAGGAARPTRVDEALAERMRRGEAEAFREYHAIRR
jgi:hypothetical protein